jgi:hypothetical protein
VKITIGGWSIGKLMRCASTRRRTGLGAGDGAVSRAPWLARRLRAQAAAWRLRSDSVLSDGCITAIVDWEAAKSGPPELNIGWWDCLFDVRRTRASRLIDGTSGLRR